MARRLDDLRAFLRQLRTSRTLKTFFTLSWTFFLHSRPCQPLCSRCSRYASASAFLAREFPALYSTLRLERTVFRSLFLSRPTRKAYANLAPLHCWSWEY